MDTYMHKTMASVASLEKIEIIRSQEFMPSEAPGLTWARSIDVTTSIVSALNQALSILLKILSVRW